MIALRKHLARRQALQQGFTLIELMISLILGLLVVAAAGTIFLSNQRTYAATQSLDRVQESVRVAFELMARDIRDAGGSPCDIESPVANVLGTTPPWYADWFQGIRGYGASDESAIPFATSAGGRVSGTEAIELKSATAGSSVSAHNATSAQITLDSTAHGLVTNDLALICDYGQTSLFRVTSAGPTSAVIAHAASAGLAPQNCTKDLGLPVACGTGTQYPYGKNSVVARVNATRWFVGSNGTGAGTSLYRAVLRGGTVGAAEEIVPGVKNLKFEYLPAGASDYRIAGSGPGQINTPGQWAEIRSVRVVIELEGREKIGPSGEVISRDFAFVAAMRNRNP